MLPSYPFSDQPYCGFAMLKFLHNFWKIRRGFFCSLHTKKWFELLDLIAFSWRKKLLFQIIVLLPKGLKAVYFHYWILFFFSIAFEIQLPAAMGKHLLQHITATLYWLESAGCILKPKKKLSENFLSILHEKVCSASKIKDLNAFFDKKIESSFLPS